MGFDKNLVVLGAVLFSTGCSSSDADPDLTGTGGYPGATGGLTGATGGSVAGPTGGVFGAGGSPGPGTGGSFATGGSLGTGGVLPGTGGVSGSGGAGASGGTPATGGGTATGGSTSTGDGGPPGACCSDGDCLCHGDAPKALTSAKGPYTTQSYTVSAGCIFYPTNAEGPFAAVAVSDGFLGSGGCGSFQTGQWGPLYASWGIVAMIINTGSSDQPNVRGQKLNAAIAAFKAENSKSGGPLSGKLAGRYGTSGFSMGGGGTTFASVTDPTLLSSVALMPWGPTNGASIKVPTLVVCGSSDGTAPCASHGTPAYNAIANTVPKMRITINSGHAGQPTSGAGKSGEYGLAFQKVFLEGDERWRPLLVNAPSDGSNIK